MEIRRGHELVSLHQNRDTVALTTRDNRLDTRLLVGADGAHSQVRKQAGIGFPGTTDERYVGRMGQVSIPPPVGMPGTSDLDVPGVGRLANTRFTRTDRGVFVHAMFQPGVYRVSVQEWDSGPVEDTADMPLDELATAAARVLGAEVPMGPPPNGLPTALTRLSGRNSRQAETYRQGRIFLVGDAAHVHSGVGGSGLNLGMQDALNLGWKLAAEINGWAPASLLDTYHTERHPVGARVIMHSRAQTALLSPGAEVTALRELFGELFRFPDTVEHLANLMAGADVHYRHGDHPLAGAWLPDLALDNGIKPAARPVLVANYDLTTEAKGWSDRVDIVTGRTQEALLIRPDGYLAWAGDTSDGLIDALRTWCGEPH